MMRANLVRAAMLAAAAALPGPAGARQPPAGPSSGSGEPAELACPARPGWATLPADRVAAWSGGWRIVDWIGVRPGGGASWNGRPIARSALLRNLDRAAAFRPQPAIVLLRVPGAGCAALAELAASVEIGRVCRPAICNLSAGADDRGALLPTRAPPPPPAPRAMRARANLAAFLSEDDYPASALRAEEEGTTTYRLDVDADGRVTGCAVVGSSGSSALDAATCRIMRSRARFVPARTAAGAPVADRVTARIVWRLPAE